MVQEWFKRETKLHTHCEPARRLGMRVWSGVIVALVATRADGCPTDSGFGRQRRPPSRRGCGATAGLAL